MQDGHEQEAQSSLAVMHDLAEPSSAVQDGIIACLSTAQLQPLHRVHKASSRKVLAHCMRQAPAQLLVAQLKSPCTAAPGAPGASYLAEPLPRLPTFLTSVLDMRQVLFRRCVSQGHC